MQTQSQFTISIQVSVLPTCIAKGMWARCAASIGLRMIRDSPVVEQTEMCFSTTYSTKKNHRHVCKTTTLTRKEWTSLASVCSRIKTTLHWWWELTGTFSTQEILNYPLTPSTFSARLTSWQVEKRFSRVWERKTVPELFKFGKVPSRRLTRCRLTAKELSECGSVTTTTSSLQQAKTAL